MDKLLVVDGSIQSADLINHWLTREGFTEVYSADSGENALAKAELIKPDIVITNVELSDISGFDLCKSLKKTMPYVQVLCVSHSESEVYRLRAFETGADDYFDTGDNYQFLSRIRSLLRVKHLSNQIRRQYAELEERNNMLEQHMRMGRRIQQALIPEIDTSFCDCRIMSMYQPALSVGGDFYSTLPLNDYCLGLVMGDVSGHGIAASFLTVTLNVMIKNLHPYHFNPSELLYHLNKEMCGLFDEKGQSTELYACVFYAMVDTRDKLIHFANAGLVQPLLANSESSTTELEANGAPIGLMPNSRYEQQSISYQQGDTLLLYTDGLQDCYFKDQPDEFLRQIKDLLNEQASQQDPNKILQSLSQHFYKTEASDHERMEMDDMSMLLCKL